MSIRKEEAGATAWAHKNRSVDAAVWSGLKKIILKDLIQNEMFSICSFADGRVLTCISIKFL